MLVFLGFSTAQNLLILTYDSMGFSEIGFFLVIIMYVAETIGNLVCSFLLGLFSSTMVMSLSILCMFIYQISLLLPVSCASLENKNSMAGLCNSHVLLIIGGLFSILVGIGCSSLWIGHGKFIGDCSQPNTIAFNMSIFWIIDQSSQIIGNYLASSAIFKSKESQFFLFSIFSMFTFIGGFVMYLIKSPEKEEKVLQKELKDSNQLPISIFQKTKASIKSTLHLLLSKEVLKIHPFILSAGIIPAYYLSVLPMFLKLKLASEGINDSIQVNQKMCSIMVLFGFADAFGSILVGKFISKFGYKISMIATGLICLLTSLSFLYSFYFTSTSGNSWYMTSFGFGMCDCSMSIVMVSMLSLKYPGKGEPFGVFNFIKNIGLFSTVFIFSIVKDILSPASILCFFAIFPVLSSILAAFFNLTKADEKEKDKIK